MVQNRAKSPAKRPIAYWGFPKTAENQKLTLEFNKLKLHLQKAAKPDSVEKHVRDFLKAYLRIGDDPTDTIIRDNVWDALTKITKGKLTEQRLDAVWEVEMNRRGRFCVIQ